MADIVKEAEYLLGNYKTKVSKDFIQRRDKKIADALKNPKNKGKSKEDFYYRWDAELPEHHQSAIDNLQELYEGFEYDTTHRILKNLDYKQNSKSGVHVSDYIQEQIAKNNVQYLVIWEWMPHNLHRVLKEDSVVEYKIIAVVNAKEALELLKKSGNNRFNWREVNERIS